MSTPSIPGVDRDALAAEVERATFVCSALTAYRAADAALAYIAAHQEPRACTCGAKYDKCPECAADDAYEKGRKDADCDTDMDARARVDLNQIIARAREALGTTQGGSR